MTHDRYIAPAPSKEIAGHAPKLLAPRSRPEKWLWREQAVAAAAVILWMIAAWFVCDWIVQIRDRNEIRRGEASAEIDALLVNGNLNRHFEMLRTVPEIIAQMPSVIALLAAIEEDKRPADAGRKMIVTQQFSYQLKTLIRHGMVRDIMILDRNGDCLSAIGWNRSFEQGCYDGSASRLKEILKTPNDIGFWFWPHQPGFLHVVPVILGNWNIGYIAAKVDNVPFRHIIYESQAFVTDENGVVILAHDPGMAMRTMPGARVYRLSSAERQKRYARQTFSALTIRPADAADPRQIYWGDEKTPRILIAHRSPGEKFSVNVMRDIEHTSVFGTERLALFGLIAGSGTMAILLIWNILVTLRRTKRHNREISRLNAILAEQASTDALTGIANRRHMLTLLETERQRGLRYATTFSLLQIDIDRFKQINDTYGHAAGDETLCHTVMLMREALRVGDAIGRTGGDEFVVMLPQTAVEQAMVVAQRMRDRVAISEWTVGNSRVQVSLSIGIAQWQPNRSEPLAALLGRADMALYEAKTAGRNRICVEMATDDDKG